MCALIAARAILLPCHGGAVLFDSAWIPVVADTLSLADKHDGSGCSSLWYLSACAPHGEMNALGAQIKPRGGIKSCMLTLELGLDGRQVGEGTVCVCAWQAASGSSVNAIDVCA